MLQIGPDLCLASTVPPSQLTLTVSKPSARLRKTLRHHYNTCPLRFLIPEQKGFCQKRWPLSLLKAGFLPWVETTSPTSPASSKTSKTSMGWWIREGSSSVLTHLSIFSGTCYPQPALKIQSQTPSSHAGRGQLPNYAWKTNGLPFPHTLPPLLTPNPERGSLEDRKGKSVSSSGRGPVLTLRQMLYFQVTHSNQHPLLCTYPTLTPTVAGSGSTPTRS